MIIISSSSSIIFNIIVVIVSVCYCLFLLLFLHILPFTAPPPPPHPPYPHHPTPASVHLQTSDLMPGARRRGDHLPPFDSHGATHRCCIHRCCCCRSAPRGIRVGAVVGASPPLSPRYRRRRPPAQGKDGGFRRLPPRFPPADGDLLL